MYKYWLILLFFQFGLQNAYAQNCDCKTLATAVVSKIEQNYIVNAALPANEKFQHYKQLIQSKESKTIQHICGALIYNLVKSLHDKHITFYYNHSGSPLFKPPVYTGNLDGQAKNRKRSSLDGRWFAEDIVVQSIKDSLQPDRFYFVIIESGNSRWKKGDIRAVLYKYAGYWYADYYRSNYNQTTLKLEITKKQINFDNAFSFYRAEALPVKRNDPELFIADSGTYAYIKLPNFSQFPYISDSLIKRHGAVISRTPHLIIDVRDNLGGSTRAYQSILPYLHTGPIRIESALYFSSPENIDKLSQALRVAKDTTTTAYKALYIQMLKLKQNPGSQVIDSGYYKTYDSVYRYPERVSILINGKTASAAELFLLAALQSKKVTVFGTNSYGVGDKLDAYAFETGCDNFMITIPVSLRVKEFYKQDIDVIGIPPQVYVDERETDLLKFVLQYKK